MVKRAERRLKVLFGSVGVKQTCVKPAAAAAALRCAAGNRNFKRTSHEPHCHASLLFLPPAPTQKFASLQRTSRELRTSFLHPGQMHLARVCSLLKIYAGAPLRRGEGGPLINLLSHHTAPLTSWAVLKQIYIPSEVRKSSLYVSNKHCFP